MPTYEIKTPSGIYEVRSARELSNTDLMGYAAKYKEPQVPKAPAIPPAPQGPQYTPPERLLQGAAGLVEKGTTYAAKKAKGLYETLTPDIIERPQKAIAKKAIQGVAGVANLPITTTGGQTGRISDIAQAYKENVPERAQKDIGALVTLLSTLPIARPAKPVAKMMAGETLEAVGRPLETLGSKTMKGYVKVKPGLQKKLNIDMDAIFAEKLKGKPDTWPAQLSEKINTYEGAVQSKLTGVEKQFEFRPIINKMKQDIIESVTNTKGGNYSGVQKEALAVLDEIDQELFAKSIDGKFSAIGLNDIKRDFYRRSRNIIQKQNMGTAMKPTAEIEARLVRDISGEFKRKLDENVPGLREINKKYGKVLSLNEGIEDALFTMENRKPGGAFLDIAGALTGAAYPAAQAISGGSSMSAAAWLLPLMGYGASRAVRGPTAAKIYHKAGTALQKAGARLKMPPSPPKIEPTIPKYTPLLGSARQPLGNLLRNERGSVGVENPQIHTDNFKNWFGDWKNKPQEASKVVDGSGKPLMVYHGTDKEVTEFSDGVAFFTDSKNLARKYSERKIFENADVSLPEGVYSVDELGGIGIREIAREEGIDLSKGKIVDAHLSIKKPLDLSDMDANFDPKHDWDKLHKKGIVEEKWNQLDEEAQVEIENDFGGKALWNFLDSEGHATIKKKGYDGVIFPDVDNDGVSHITYAVFSPSQVKSATGNSGAFNSAVKDIRGSSALKTMAATAGVSGGILALTEALNKRSK